LSRREISTKEYSLLRQIFTTTEDQLLKALGKTLELYYDKKNLIRTNSYIYAIGEIPIALVAHLDTVHKAPPTEFFHDPEKGCIWTPEGLGADDRAGVFSILMLLRGGYRPSVIFLTQEERGGIGAEKFIQNWPMPATEINFLVELDRQGCNDAVYYECGNEKFENFISSFGFVTEWGSFSDISIIAPKWDRAAVNLSVGYYHEHTLCEFLNYRYMFSTIEKVKQILENYNENTVYNFERVSWGMAAPWIFGGLAREKNGQVMCDCCETWTPDDAVVRVSDVDDDEFDIFRLCPTCVEKYVIFCSNCGRAILDPYHTNTDGLCEKCRNEKGVDVKA